MKDLNMIMSSSNKLIKEIKSLHNKKDRWNKKCFFIEGTRSIEQCMKSKIDIKYIVYSEELLGSDGFKLIEQIENYGYELYEISKSIFKEISDTDNPQGILAVVEFMENTIESALKEENFFILLDRVQDPGNMGTIIRTADAFGANGVIVTNGCVDVYNPKTVRSTMGSIFQIPIIHMRNIDDAIETLKNKNINIISTSLNTDKYSYDIDFIKDSALVIGNEANGVSEQIIENSDELVKIPMSGSAESLNAGVASAVLMYEVLRQRSLACNIKTSML